MLYLEPPRPSAIHPNQQHWNLIRNDAILRDGKCRCCGSFESLEAHHITYKNFGYESIDDVTTLCRECHYAITISIRSRRNDSKPKDVQFNLDQIQDHEDRLFKMERRLSSMDAKSSMDDDKMQKLLGGEISSEICNVIGDSNMRLDEISGLMPDSKRLVISDHLRALVRKGVLVKSTIKGGGRGRPKISYSINK